MNEQENGIRQFIRIKFLDEMATDIAYFAQNQGYVNMMDKIDLTCGAIPEGGYNQIIDPGAPNQFLEFYMHIAEFRFAFAVVETLKMNQGYWPAIKKYCYDKGCSLKPEKLESAEEAFNLINSVILDGMPDQETKSIISAAPEKIEWKKVTETHASFWEKVGSIVDLYYDLQNCIIQGLLSGSKITFSNNNNELFTLEMQS